MILAFGSWKVEQLEGRYDLPLNQPYLDFCWYFFKINSLAHMFLRWHSWYAHVVYNSSLRQLANLSLQSIGLCRARLGGKVASPMLCILLSQKLVLVKVRTLHIPIIGKWIIKDGEGNGHNTNMMGCGEQTIYCAFERIWPWAICLFFSFFLCLQAAPPPFYFTR